MATFYREMLHWAGRRGRRMSLVVPGAADAVEQVGEGVRIYHVRGRALRMSPGYRLIMPHNYLLPGGAIGRILRQEQPDLVECCDRYTLNYMAALLRKQLLPGYRGRPVVVGLHCERMDQNMSNYVSAHPAARAFCRWYLRWLQFPMFDHHIAVSPEVAEELSRVADGHDVRRGVWVAPMGVDSETFTPTRRDPEFRRWLEHATAAPEGSTLLLYVGRLAPEKNASLLIETMAALEQRSPGTFHLVVAGDGPLRGALEKEADERLPGAAAFLGHVADRNQLAGICANCDVFLHPNPNEPFGIAPLEAMASGMAVVAPDEGGIRSYAHDGNAWLRPPEAARFADAVEQIRHDPRAAALRREEARRTAERFGWERAVDRYFGLYDDLYALTRGERTEPHREPAFYSTPGRRLGWSI